MRNIKTVIFLGVISIQALALVACSDSTNENIDKEKVKTDHVWKTQTDALKSAKDMAKKLQENLNQRQEKLDENN